MVDKIEKYSMRTAYGNSLAELMKKNSKIVILAADTEGGTHVSEASKKYRNRTYNFGIAEQNMFCAAAGMANTKLIPFVNTYGIFASMRALEMLRTSIALNKSNVKVIVSHLGLDVGQDGPTHQVIEDISIIRSIPGMTILSPLDKIDLYQQLKWAIKYNGPVYLRTGRRKIITYLNKNYKFEIGKWPIILDGKKVCIIALQVMMEATIEAVKLLKSQNIFPLVLHASSLKPIDEKDFLNKTKNIKAFVTVEDHNKYGGLGSIVSEILSNKNPRALEQVGVMDTFGKSGDANDVFNKFNLTSMHIFNKTIAAIKRIMVE